jgi:hypothetical protein
VLQKIGDELERRGNYNFLLVMVVARELVAIPHAGKLIAHIMSDDLDFAFNDRRHHVRPSALVDFAGRWAPANPSEVAGD